MLPGFFLEHGAVDSLTVLESNAPELHLLILVMT